MLGYVYDKKGLDVCCYVNYKLKKTSKTSTVAQPYLSLFILILIFVCSVSVCFVCIFDVLFFLFNSCLNIYFLPDIVYKTQVTYFCLGMCILCKSGFLPDGNYVSVKTNFFIPGESQGDAQIRRLHEQRKYVELKDEYT